MSFTQEKKINCNEYSINQKAKGIIVVNDVYGASWACAGCKMHCVTGATQSAVQQMFVPSIAGIAIERYVGERGVV